jgi:hypothetical protein
MSVSCFALMLARRAMGGGKGCKCVSLRGR